jgi:acetolactate synthase-1/2/3 large subunit
MSHLALLPVPQTPARPAAEVLPVSGAKALLDVLVDLGVDTIFGYPGGAVLPVYDALHAETRLRHVLVRHEQAAVHAAEGYARTTGRPGVVLVTSGPGVSNTLTGLLDAFCDSVPVVCISGQVATQSIGTDAFQECDALGLSRPVTKWNAQIRHADQVAALTRKAFRIAMEGRPGPVLLDFPKDLQLAPTGSAGRTAAAQAEPKRKPLRRGPLRDAAALLKAARRPVFYGGGGLINSGNEACASFTRLVQRSGAPCTLTLMGLGAFPASDRQYLGMLGMHGSLEANLAMHRADLVICVGARFDDRVTGKLSEFCPHAKKIHLDIDASSIDKVVKVDVPMVGDCLELLEALHTELGDHEFHRERLDEWWKTINEWRSRDSLGFEARGDCILPQQLMRSLQDAIGGRDVVVSTDVGQHQMWAAQHFRFEQPRRWLTSGGAGTMGYGLPAAIGAQIAHPDKLVVCVSGDASVLMNLQELSTAVQHRAAVKVVLCNNGYMGMVRQWQELNHGGRYSHSYTAALPDFVAVARGFGWGARRVGDPAALAAAIAECLAYDGPFFLDVAVAAQANCFPMIPSGCGHHQVMLNETTTYKSEQ